jgi:hypothetical protein
MPDEHVVGIINKMRDYKKVGKVLPYDSLLELREDDPEVAAWIKQAGISDSAVIKRMHKLAPSMQRCRLIPKKSLSIDLLLDRLKTAKRCKRTSMMQQLAWVFIDAKSMKMQIDRLYGWIDKDQHLDIAEVQRAPRKNSNVPKLDYYIAVGGYVGALDMYFYTGTTGLKPDRGPITFKVR